MLGHHRGEPRRLASMRLSRDPAARRRLLALAAIALAALVAGAAVGARGGSAPGRSDAPAPTAAPPPATVEPRAALERRVGQLLILRFVGPRVPGYVTRALREGRAAGVVLFADNIEGPEQLRRLTATIQRAAGGGALVCTDQEGGPVRNVPGAGPEPAQPAQSTPALATEAARVAARDLRDAGVNVNLAPVADVPSGPAPVMGARAFPGGAGAVGALVRAAVLGYRRDRVAATVKHFPGLGAASINTDDAPVTITAGAAELERRDLEPFRAAVDAGAPLVMASHALYPALDRERIASQSPRVLGDLLRGELRFGGVVMTDSLEAAAVTARGSIETAATRSVEAGADLVLMTGRGSYTRVHRRLVRRTERSAALRRRVGESVRRVARLKRELGLRAPAA